MPSSYSRRRFMACLAAFSSAYAMPVRAQTDKELTCTVSRTITINGVDVDAVLKTKASEEYETSTDAELSIPVYTSSNGQTALFVVFSLSWWASDGKPYHSSVRFRPVDEMFGKSRKLPAFYSRHFDIAGHRIPPSTLGDGPVSPEAAAAWNAFLHRAEPGELFFTLPAEPAGLYAGHPAEAMRSLPVRNTVNIQEVFKELGATVKSEIEKTEQLLQSGKSTDGTSCFYNCFLTTATVDVVGLSDDSFELTALRRLRDTHLQASPEGRALVEEYYRIAPGIVRRVNARPDARRIWMRAYAGYILPCAVLARLGLSRLAQWRYTRLVRRLEAY